VLAALPAGAHPQVRHQCGARHTEACTMRYRDAGVDASIEPFIADMAAALAWADLVICRAGALTLAEVCAAGVGSLLVPCPRAVDDHQTRNAEYLVERGAAMRVAEGADFGQRLSQQLLTLLQDPGQRLAMALAARACAMPDAARRVADRCLAEALA
jgi:UDP-N-acetylglucosamine--N-acetylmuramyl-(pentapeptide) pyrophosphoryl-undecaprenol N-acetylglucosamine transferase